MNNNQLKSILKDRPFITIETTTSKKTQKSLDLISIAVLGYELPFQDYKYNKTGWGKTYKLSNETGYQTIAYYIAWLMYLTNSAGNPLKVVYKGTNEVLYTSLDYIK